MKKIATIFCLSALALFMGQAVVAQGYAVGDVATDFSLMGTDGSDYSLSSYEDAKGYIVVFTCNHCPFAKMYEDRLIAIHNEWAPKGYPVVAINPNDDEIVPEDGFKQMIIRSQEKGFTFDYLWDEDQTIYPQYGATKTPHVYLLDADRKVRYIGAIDDNARDEAEVTQKYLVDALTALENGQDPDPATTKAVGCSIKAQ